MTNTYQKDSQFCAAPITDLHINRITTRILDILHGVLGIKTEVDELTEAYETSGYNEKELDIVNLKEELGDICWYVANLSNAIEYEPNWEKETESKYKEPFLVLPEDVDTFNFFINNCKLGVISGKLVDSMKRNIFYGVEVDVESIKENINTIINTLHIMADNLCTTLEKSQQLNIDKLTERYGKEFSEDAAVNRNLESEREILEETK